MKFDYEKEVAQATVTPRGKVYNTPISPRDNDMAMGRHKEPQWIGQELNHIMCREIKDNVARGMIMDGRPYEGELGGLDMFGVEWVFVPVVRGSMEKPGVHLVPDIEEWESYVTMPVLDALDWEQIKADCAKQINPNKVTSTMIFSGFFERLISFIGFEEAAVALIDEDQQDAVHRLFDQLCGYYDKLLDKLKTYIGLEYVVFHDDWGSQRSTFFSYDTCEEMLFPYLKRVIQSAHDKDIVFNFHCCGKVETLVPLMIEAGADAWDGQPMNDIWGLYDKYGDKLNITLNEKVLDVTPEQAEVWVDNIVSHLQKGKHLIISARQMNAVARELMYVKSRQFYSE